MCDEILDLQFSSHYFVNQFWYILSALPASESSAFPRSASDQLERSSSDFFARCCYSYDAALSEPSMRRLQSSSHHLHITSAVVSVIDSPLLFR